MNIRFMTMVCLIAIACEAFGADGTKAFGYLQNLQSASLDFVQVDSRGASAEGKLIIVKPHKFRCNYYAPYPLLVLGNKNEIVVYDYQLEQTTRISADENLFNFLLMDSKEWEKNFEVRDVAQEGDAVLYKLYHAVTDRFISLVFQNNKFELKQIIIDEPDGNVIEIVISNVTKIQKVAEDLFFLPNPDVFGKPKRLDKKVLEGRYL